MVAQKLGVEARQLQTLRDSLSQTQGDIVIMFAAELSAAAQAVIAQLPSTLRTDGRRVLLHPLPRYNNSVGAHDVGLAKGAMTAPQMLDAAGAEIRALYMAGSFTAEQLTGRETALDKLEFFVVQELFETATTAFADVVLPAASFAEVDGTFTNNDGFVQRVRQSISPVHQAKPDWVITAQLAAEFGADFGFAMSAGAVFREIAKTIPAYAGLNYPLLKDESNPVQAKYNISENGNSGNALSELKQSVQALPGEGGRVNVTPKVGHKLFAIGTLTGKTPQFQLLAEGNPRPETLRISPLYQIAGISKQ